MSAILERGTVQEWTDGIALVRREGRTVTVQILGDVYVTQYEDDDEAAIAFAGEIAQELDSSNRIAGVLADYDDEEGDAW